MPNKKSMSGDRTGPLLMDMDDVVESGNRMSEMYQDGEDADKNSTKRAKPRSKPKPPLKRMAGGKVSSGYKCSHNRLY